MFAVLHVPFFALQSVLRARAAPVDAPAALVSDDRRKPCVLELNPAAAASRVTPGLTAPQALARCPTLAIHTRQPVDEHEARQALLACGFSLSPRIEDTAPGICTADLAGAAEASQSDNCRTVLARLAALGLHASAGLARTPWLALLAARAAAAGLPSAAAATSAPFLAVGAEPGFLAPLPLAAAEPSPEMADVLAGWGIRTLGELTALPKSEIAHRLGAAGLALWERAAGVPERPLRHVAPPRDFVAATDFEHPVETLEPLLFVLRRFVGRLALDFANAGCVAAELHLRLDLTDETGHTRGFRLPEPTGNPDILFRALHTHLESLRTDAEIGGVRLEAVPTRPLVKEEGLFDTGLRDPHGFAETLARAVALAGSGQVGTPHPEGSHRPDAFTIIPPAAIIPPQAAPPVHPPVGLPLRRFRPPLPATVETSGLHPVSLAAAHLSGPIRDRRGPWRTSGEWWQPSAWSRIEWDVELEGGGLYRLLRTRDGWFLEGEYD